jgi:ppGpp synthetase/RelA/SpoT-type nucleotidyltranferase
MAGKILDNGALVTLGLVGVVAAAGVMARRGAANVKVKGQIGRDTYPSLFEDDDDDGVLNPDDPHPRIPGDRHGIEEVSIAQQVGKFIDLRSAMQPKLDRLLNELNQHVSPTAKVKGRVKTPFSMINKLRRKRVFGGKGLTDIVGTMIVDEPANINRYITAIKAGKYGRVVDEEDHYANRGKPNDRGYRAVHFVVERGTVNDGEGTEVPLPVEIQLKTKRMSRFSARTHTSYKRGDLDVQAARRLADLIQAADEGDRAAASTFDAMTDAQIDRALKGQLDVSQSHRGSRATLEERVADLQFDVRALFAAGERRRPSEIKQIRERALVQNRDLLTRIKEGQERGVDTRLLERDLRSRMR